MADILELALAAAAGDTPAADTPGRPLTAPGPSVKFAADVKQPAPPPHSEPPTRRGTPRPDVQDDAAARAVVTTPSPTLRFPRVGGGKLQAAMHSVRDKRRAKRDKVESTFRSSIFSLTVNQTL